MEKNDNFNNKKDNLIDKIFFKKYRCIEKIGQGSFGFIYKAEYNNKYYALKFEDNKNEKQILENEASLMIYLKGPNIPYIKTYGTSGQYNILVMQLLGKDLQELLREKGSFSIKTVCILAYQMISILEHIHTYNIIHRDIKPENFLMGLDENNKFLYLLDFGLAKTFDYNSTTTNYMPNKEGKKLTGTPRYASINALRGLEQSPRDDLESVGYVLVYLLKGSLPWQSIKARNKYEKVKNILVYKIETSSSDLCSGLPNEFENYIDYCKNLEINEIPDYERLKNLFLSVLHKEKEEFDYIYDWTEPEEGKKKKKKIFFQNNNKNDLDKKIKTNNINNNLITEYNSLVADNEDKKGNKVNYNLTGKGNYDFTGQGIYNITEKGQEKETKNEKESKKENKKEKEKENTNKMENKKENKKENKNENKKENNEDDKVDGNEVKCCIIY